MMQRHFRWMGILLSLIVVASRPAIGLFHLAVIDEVLTSYNGDTTAQFVEIRMLAATQNFVAHSILGVFDGKGTFLGEFEVPGDVANSGSGVPWLMATSSFQTASGIAPDFVIPPILPSGGGMICWGAPGVLPPDPSSTWDHTNPTQYIDCVAYGLYSGPTNSKVGTPTTLTADHHSLQRGSIMANNNVDFSCSLSITPRNNAGATTTLPATDVCSSAPSVVFDAVLATRSALNVTIPSGTTSVTKKLKLVVRNLSAATQTLGLDLQSDCPPGVSIRLTDFDPMMSGIQPAAPIAANKSLAGTALVTVDSTAFTNFNHRAASRCTITATALNGNLLPNGAFDEAFSNNVLPVEVNIVDKNDPDQTGSPETFVKSVAPKKITVADLATSKTIKATAVAGNGDPAETLGHTIAVTGSNGTCPFGTVGTADMDGATPGDQPSITVKGGKTKGAKLPVTATSTMLTSNSKSPARCVALISATGPSEPETAPRDPSNGTAHLVVDIVDKNDF